MYLYGDISNTTTGQRNEFFSPFFFTWPKSFFFPAVYDDKLSISQKHSKRDKYGLPQSRVLWLAGSSSWSSPHKKVRSRVTSFCSSGLGIGWERSRRGVSLGRMSGGWSRKLSKMSEGQRTTSLTFLSLFPLHNWTHYFLTWVRRTSGQLRARGRGPGCWWGSGGTQFVMSEQVVQLGRA